MNTQKRLFDYLDHMLPGEHKMANAVAELLNIKVDSAYRRIRGETDLSYAEFEKICRKFNLSADKMMNLKTKHNIKFQYSPVSDESSYADNMMRLSDRLHCLRLASEKELLFTAEDIPFYHFLKYPELAIFRIYAWHNTQHRDAEPFCDFYGSSENSRIIPIYEKIYDDCMHIPTKEIWTLQTVDTTVRLLEYYYDTCFFNNRDTALRLAGQLMSLLDTVKQHATDGHRDGEAKTPFALYHCAVDVENNFMMQREGKEWSCSIKLYAINRITTDNEYLCSEIRQWIENLILKSILISGTALREQVQFFNSAKEKVQNLINRISTK